MVDYFDKTPDFEIPKNQRSDHSSNQILLEYTMKLEEVQQRLQFVVSRHKIDTGEWCGGMIENFIDVTESKRIKSILMTQNEILKCIAAGSSYQELLDKLCLIIEEQSPGALCSILLIDRNNECLRPGAGPSIPNDYMQLLDGLEIGACAGSCGTAAFLGKAVIVSDVEKDPRWEGFQIVAARFNIKACWSMPFYSTSGSVLGTFAISHNWCCSPSPFHYRLLETASSLAGIATENKKVLNELAKSKKLESLGTLAGGMAHDFNNLLTAILGNIQLAKQPHVSTESSKNYLVSAERAIWRAKDITNQLLTFAKGGSPLTRAESIKNVIVETVEFTQLGSTVGCTMDLPNNLPPIEIDKGQISQVIHNVIINALQAMPNGGIIEISAKVTAEKDIPFKKTKGKERFLKITVIDQGLGIPPNHLSNIFDPFYSTKEDGRGLGLAISYSIMKQHGGWIGIKSTLGKGTTVSMLLPVPGNEVGQEKKTVQSLDALQGSVLVMDDEEYIRDVLDGMLSHLNIDTRFANDGTEAVKIYTEQMKIGKRFNAVILDLTIPGKMGGEDTLKELRSIDPNVKAIASSGYSNDPIMTNYEKYGFAAVLPKPYELQALQRIMENVLKS